MLTARLRGEAGAPKLERALIDIKGELLGDDLTLELEALQNIGEDPRVG